MQQHRGHIFVVEDDPGLNQAVGRLLQAAGFRTHMFDSAEAMLADPALRDADCFVVDIHLPGISGFDLPDRLRRRNVHAPVIFITARDDLLHRRKARELGVAEYLPKPFSSDVLIDSVVRAMKDSSAG